MRNTSVLGLHKIIIVAVGKITCFRTAFSPQPLQDAVGSPAGQIAGSAILQAVAISKGNASKKMTGSYSIL